MVEKPRRRLIRWRDMSRALVTLSTFLNGLRGLFMPLGLMALLAVGVHAGADLLDDRLLRLIDGLDAGLDGLWARWELTARWVNAFDAPERTLLARGGALLWELFVDVLLCLPLVGYRERSEAFDRGGQLTQAWQRTLRQPTPMRLFRPVETAVFVVAGAYGVQRLVQSTLFLGLTGDVAPASVAAVIARALGVAAMGLVLVSPGWRSVLRAFEHADAASTEATGVRARLTVGLWGSALALPLVLLLVAEARSLLSVVL
jgi:hypothetical protein